MFENIIVSLVFIGSAIIVGVVFGYSINQSERIDCLKWQQEAKDLPLFYLTQSEANTCSYWNIPVNAPIHD